MANSFNHQAMDAVRAFASGFTNANLGAEEETPPACECDNTHQANDTVCRWCWAHGRRHWDDPDVAAAAAPREYRYHQDPGHGWIEVPEADLEALGITRRDISRYSYLSNARAFLEEDCDAARFMAAAKAAGWDVKLTELHTEGDSFVRGLPRHPGA